MAEIIKKAGIVIPEQLQKSIPITDRFRVG